MGLGCFEVFVIFLSLADLVASTSLTRHSSPQRGRRSPEHPATLHHRQRANTEPMIDTPTGKKSSRVAPEPTNLCGEYGGTLTENVVVEGHESSKLCYYVYDPSSRTSPAILHGADMIGSQDRLSEFDAHRFIPSLKQRRLPVLIVHGIGDYAYTFYSLAEDLRQV